MKVMEIQPLGTVRGVVRVPGSKSITNRALVCGALARGESRIINPSDSTDTALLINGLNQLGVLARNKENALCVSGKGGRLFAPKFPIPVGNAGTTTRFLMALGVLAEGDVTLELDERMADRPIEEFVDALAQLDITINTPSRTRRTVSGQGLRGGAVRMRADRSSQFLSALLMIAPYATGDIVVIVDTPLVSRPYVDLTMQVMSHFGIDIESEGNSFTVRGRREYIPSTFDVEPDASSAMYLFAVAAILGGEVVVEGLNRKSLQADSAFLDILEKMGCSVQEDNVGVRVIGPATLKPVDVDMSSMPDCVPTLAAIALFVRGTTHIRNIAHLRFKESDRLDSITMELRKLGGGVSVSNDSITIEPGVLHGAQLDTYEDHRLAMSFALIGLRVPGVRIENPDCVRKSFPGFWFTLEQLRGRN